MPRSRLPAFKLRQALIEVAALASTDEQDTDALRRRLASIERTANDALGA